MPAMPWACPQRCFFHQVLKGTELKKISDWWTIIVVPFYHLQAPSPASGLALLWRTPGGGSSLCLHWGGSEVPGRLSSASAGVKARLLGHFRVPCGIRLKLSPLGLPESTPCLVLPCPGLLPQFPRLQAFPGALPKHTVGILTLAPGDAAPTESPLGRRRPSVQLCSVLRGNQFTKVRLSPERIRPAQVPGAGALTAVSDTLREALLLVQLVRG